MNCAILQPSYIPWRGYFHQIQKVDTFVFYDDVQYDRHGWRNRNRVKTASGAKWLTVPHKHLGYSPAILEVEIADDARWVESHLGIVREAYKKAPFFKQYFPIFEDILRRRHRHLADLTIDLTVAFAGELGLTGKKFLRSSTLGIGGNKTDRLIAILTALGATHYVSGPSARDYIEPEKFANANIGLEYMVYDYPEYPQLHGAYDPQLSILDLLFMTGKDAGNYIWTAAPALTAAAILSR